VILSGASAYTLASGVLVPVLAVILGLWVGRPRWYLMVLLVAAIGWPASYLWGYETPRNQSNPFDLSSHILFTCLHFLVQIGGPFFRAIEDGPDLFIAAILGSLGLAFFVGGLVFVILRPVKPQQKTLALFAIYLLGTAYLTAIGRVHFGVGQALSPRYSTPMMGFWLSTFLLWFGNSASGPRLRLFLLLVSVPIAAMAALSEPRFVAEGLKWALARKLATPALLAGVDDARLSDLHWNPDVVLEGRAGLLSSGTSVFSQKWARLMGAKFAEQFAVYADDRCAGSFLWAEPVNDAGSGWSAVGTAWRKPSFDALRRIVLVDSDGLILGYGLGGLEPFSVGGEPNPETLDRPVWWSGDFGKADPSKVRAYALDYEGRACMIGFPHAVKRAIAVAPLPAPAPELGGYVDSATLDTRGISIAGWGYLSAGDGEVKIDTDLPVRSMSLTRVARPGVASAMKDTSLYRAGFQARITLRRNAGDESLHRLCVWTEDAKYGRRLLYSQVSASSSNLFVCAGNPTDTAAPR
jgi:hypothetical protein